MQSRHDVEASHDRLKDGSPLGPRHQAGQRCEAEDEEVGPSADDAMASVERVDDRDVSVDSVEDLTGVTTSLSDCR